MKRTTKFGEHYYNLIAPLTITDYNDRGLGPSLCSLFTIISLNIFTTYYTKDTSLKGDVNNYDIYKSVFCVRIKSQEEPCVSFHSGTG